MARIVTVYTRERRGARMVDMSGIRWHKISEALARRGHEVDMATGEFRWRLRQRPIEVAERLRRVPLSRVDWRAYDVVKTLFHEGFRILERYGGARHPFIVSKLGSVVGPTDMEGIYFYGRRRASMFDVQERIAAASRYVTVLTEPARELWRDCFGDAPPTLLVPGAVDREIPPPGADPYPGPERPRCLFAGNFYRANPRRGQPEAGATIARKLNELGARLAARGARLFVLGPGDAERLEPRHVSYLGAVPYQESWNWLQHADVGILVSAGPFMQNNESTKIYHYLRAGLPIAAERGFPNDALVREAGLGFQVESGDLEALARRALEAAERSWDREAAVRYLLARHTWDDRAAVYDEVLRKELGGR